MGDIQILPYLNNYFQVTNDEIRFEQILETLIKLIIEGIGNKEGE